MKTASNTNSDYIHAIVDEIVDALYEQGASDQDELEALGSDPMFNFLLDQMKLTARKMSGSLVETLMTLSTEIVDKLGQQQPKLMRSLLLKECQNPQKVKLTGISQARTVEMIDTFLHGKSMDDFYAFVLADRIDLDRESFILSINRGVYGNHTD